MNRARTGAARDTAAGAVVPVSLRFGSVELRLATREVLSDGQPLALGARAFDILVALALRSGRVVSKEELLAIVWPTSVVEEANLRVSISAIRKCLGPDVISTIPGRGYQFTVPGVSLADGAPADEAEIPAPAYVRSSILIGREGLVARIRSILGESRLLTLTGASGSGKTALARQIFEEAQIEATMAVRWVDLAPLSRGELVAATIARAVEVTLPVRDEIKALAMSLKSAPMLLILDNAEHLVEQVAAVAHALIQWCPQVRILVTSQVKLNIVAEAVQLVPPLELAPRDTPPEEAQHYGALALFLHRCEKAGRPLRKDSSTMEAAAEVCRRLDGLPLAIEYAAALVPVLGLAGILEAIDQRMLSLGSSRRDAPERHRSLRSTLQWSYGLLGETEQAVFRRLGIFVGGCSLELFRDVVVLDDVDTWRVVEALADLIDRSLVVSQGEQLPRYRLLEAARAFATESLAESGERPLLERQHAERVTLFFEREYARSLYEGQGIEVTVDRLLIEIDNARAAFEWALHHDHSLALRLCTPLTFALIHSGGWSEVDRYLLATAPLAEQPLPDAIRAQWALSAAHHWALRDRVQALRWAEFAIAVFRRVNDPQGLFMALIRKAECVFQSPHHLETERALLSELEQLNGRAWPGPVRAAGALAIWKLYLRVDPNACLTTQLQSALAAVADDQHADTILRCNVMELHNQAGRYEEAVAIGEALRAKLQDTRRRALLSFVLGNLTHAYLHLERWVMAWQSANQAMRIASTNDLLHIPCVSVAVLACRDECYEEVACLLGFADNGYRIRQHRRGDVEESFRLRAYSQAREALGEQRFERHYKEGEAADELAIRSSFQRLAPKHSH